MCLDIQLKIDDDKNEENIHDIVPMWKLGACHGVNYDLINIHYPHPVNYTERCCLAPGLHTLMCYNSPPARGWRNWYILIDGHRYCDNFVGYMTFQQISVSSMHFRLIGKLINDLITEIYVICIPTNTTCSTFSTFSEIHCD